MQKFLLYIFLLTGIIPAQNNLNLALKGSYTTSAKIFLTPNASDPEIRNRSFILNSFFNNGIEARFSINENINLSLNVEYISVKGNGRNLIAFSNNNSISLNVEDGFNLIPIEISGFYKLPFSSESILIFMGGGFGYYYGEMIRNFADISVSTIDRKTAYGIHVIVSTDYLINKYFAIRGEMKFRDPQFIVNSEYNKQTTIYEGNEIFIGQKTFDTKINVDGVTFTLGLVLNFSL